MGKVAGRGHANQKGNELKIHELYDWVTKIVNPNSIKNIPKTCHLSGMMG